MASIKRSTDISAGSRIVQEDAAPISLRRSFGGPPCIQTSKAPGGIGRVERLGGLRPLCGAVGADTAEDRHQTRGREVRAPVGRAPRSRANPLRQEARETRTLPAARAPIDSSAPSSSGRHRTRTSIPSAWAMAGRRRPGSPAPPRGRPDRRARSVRRANRRSRALPIWRLPAPTGIARPSRTQRWMSGGNSLPGSRRQIDEARSDSLDRRAPAAPVGCAGPISPPRVMSARSTTSNLLFE